MRLPPTHLPTPERCGDSRLSRAMVPCSAGRWVGRWTAWRGKGTGYAGMETYASCFPALSTSMNTVAADEVFSCGCFAAAIAAWGRARARARQDHTHSAVGVSKTRRALAA